MNSPRTVSSTGIRGQEDNNRIRRKSSAKREDGIFLNKPETRSLSRQLRMWLPTIHGNQPLEAKIACKSRCLKSGQPIDAQFAGTGVAPSAAPSGVLTS